MKGILMSVRPEWCKKIFSGEKTIEVRKTRPKIEPPFRVFVYQTKEKESLLQVIKKGDIIGSDGKGGDVFYDGDEPLFIRCTVQTPYSGKVIGTFICDKVEEFSVGGLQSDDIRKEACLTYEGLIKYFYKPNELDGITLKFGYGWHITEPRLFHGTLDLWKIGAERAPLSWQYLK